MDKLIATIKYGSAKTRLYLLAIAILLLAGAVLSVYGINSYSLAALGGGVLALIAGLTMILMANFVTSEIDSKDEHEGEASDNIALSGTGVKRSRIPEERTGRSESTAREDDEYEEDFGVIDDKAGSRIKQDSSEEALDETESTGIRGREVPKEPESRTEDWHKYTPEVFRRILRRYKVKRNYIPIIIDSARCFDTEKTPALCWSKKNLVYFLLIEGNERVVSMPLSKFLKVSYRREVAENNIEAYNKLRNELEIYDKFEDVMPAFSSSSDRMGRSSFSKNLYVLGNEVSVTPKSLRALREKFSFDMNIFDSLGVRGEYSIYFKKAYEARVLWVDTVIGQQEYQNRIGNILQTMVDDTELIRYDFLEELEKMVQNRLITTEYADYYMQQREKRDAVTTRRK